MKSLRSLISIFLTLIVCSLAASAVNVTLSSLSTDSKASTVVLSVESEETRNVTLVTAGFSADGALTGLRVEKNTALAIGKTSVATRLPSVDDASVKVYVLDEGQPLATASFEPAMRDYTLDYSARELWAYSGDGEEKPADVFFIPPTTYGGSRGSNMKITDAELKTKNNIIGAVNMQRGVYDQYCRLFAPFYRQIGISTYVTLGEEELASALDLAYADVKASFLYYFEHENNGRPYIISGFSQGADMAIRLMKELFADPKYTENLVAVYAPGWRLTEEEIKAYPQIVPAKGETDTGVIIVFNSEDAETTDTMMVPAGVKSVCINPLNWKTDATPADKSLNQGAVFLDKQGNVISELPNLTGCTIDLSRGTLKVTDVTRAEYPAYLNTLKDGCFHYYETNFYYRNLQENVAKRVVAFLNAHNISD